MLSVSFILLAIQYLTYPVKPAWGYIHSNLHAAYHALVAFEFDNDSWQPMIAARHWLATHSRQDVYQALFFGKGIKFQYPATSLLFIEWLPTDTETSIRMLNLANLLSFVGVVVGMVLVTLGLVDRLQCARLRFDRQSRLLLAAVAAMGTLCFYPLLRALELGQIQVVLDAFFVFACYSYIRGHLSVAGILIGLSTLIKPQMGLFLVWGLLRRDWRFVAGLLVPVALGLVASAALYGPGWPFAYLKVLSFIGSHGESFFPNQSVNGLLNRLLQSSNNLEWEPAKFAPHDPIVSGATGLTSAVLVLIGLFDWRRPLGHGSILSLMFAGICFSMASPVAWEHHYGVLLPAFAYCLVSLIARELALGTLLWKGRIALAVTFLVAANSFAMANFLANTPLNVLQSYLLFAALGVLGLSSVLDRAPTD